MDGLSVVHFDMESIVSNIMTILKTVKVSEIHWGCRWM